MLTSAAFLERIDATVLAQLTDSSGQSVDQAKVDHALADAWGQIEGYLYHLPAADRPDDSTLEAHQVALTLYALAGNRPGVEFESIAKRAKKSIEWLESVAERARKVGVTAQGESPEPVYDECSLNEMGDLGPVDRGGAL